MRRVLISASALDNVIDHSCYAPHTYEGTTYLHVGYWKRQPDSMDYGDDKLVWPVMKEAPDTRLAEFDKLLLEAQRHAKRNTYRGVSRCRLCGGSNGNAEFEFSIPGHKTIWCMPSGYPHYLHEHNVHIDDNFFQFLQKFVGVRW